MITAYSRAPTADITFNQSLQSEISSQKTRCPRNEKEIVSAIPQGEAAGVYRPRCLRFWRNASVDDARWSKEWGGGFTGERGASVEGAARQI